MNKIFILLFILAIPMISLGQDTIFQKDLTFENNIWLHNGKAYTGSTFNRGYKTTDHYTYCEGKPCGYKAYYFNGQLAGEHIYDGENIHLIFYTEEGKKTLEYHQIIKDHTYMTGEWIDYREDGTIQVKGNYILVKEYVNGRGGEGFEWTSKKDGEWTFYNEKVELIKTETWKKDILKKTKNEK